ncbi:MAG: NAD/NADP octopine/nopaline dehydrogenase [Alphaproteobacteria bacterium]|nr:NAD/NADP octopine/nopaline dehydrogenase [Alphaproteobacteria bacterium]
MRVAILGAGGIGLATAALLCRNGHAPAIWSPSSRITKLDPLVAEGAVDGAFRVDVAASCAEAMSHATAVIFALPAYGHRVVMDEAIRHLRAGQTAIISSQYSLGALYLAERRPDVPVVAWGTTVVMGRPIGPSRVKVLTIRAQVDASVLPGSTTKAGLHLCRELFGDRFVPRADLLAIQLSNVNPEAHMANALCNLTRMEKGEIWDNYGGITDTVGRLIEALDDERLAVAGAFGVEVRTIHQHMHLSFDLPYGSMGAMAAGVAAMGGSPGPTSLQARWIREDLPFGLVPTVVLAGIAAVPTPLHAAGLRLFSALLGRDLDAENDLFPALALTSISASDIRDRVRR